MSIFNIFKKNVSKYDSFIEDCKKAIVTYEIESSPSCVDDLIEAIKIMTKGAKDDINMGRIPPSQYYILINKLLSNCTFELLISGKYHIYRGTLNSMSCAANLMNVHNKSLDFALKCNMITQIDFSFY